MPTGHVHISLSADCAQQESYRAISTKAQLETVFFSFWFLGSQVLCSSNLIFFPHSVKIQKATESNQGHKQHATSGSSEKKIRHIIIPWSSSIASKDSSFDRSCQRWNSWAAEEINVVQGWCWCMHIPHTHMQWQQKQCSWREPLTHTSPPLLIHGWAPVATGAGPTSAVLGGNQILDVRAGGGVHHACGGGKKAWHDHFSVMGKWAEKEREEQCSKGVKKGIQWSQDGLAISLPHQFIAEG